MNQKEYWNSVSDTKVFSTPFNVDEFTKIIEKDKVIFDVGCGYGRILNEFFYFGKK